MKQLYRKGALGALMEEYERAASELQRVLEEISEAEFVRIVDEQTRDENCRSVQTIMAHVVSAGYGYAAYMRSAFAMNPERPAKRLLALRESREELQAMLDYTIATLEGRWEMTNEGIRSAVMHTNWGVTYDLEQMLSHAIVHVLRHRLQIEKFIALMRRD